MRRGTIVVIKPNCTSAKMSRGGWVYPPTYIPQPGILYTIRGYVAPDAPGIIKYCISTPGNAGIFLEELQNDPHPDTKVEVAWDIGWFDIICEPDMDLDKP